MAILSIFCKIVFNEAKLMMMTKYKMMRIVYSEQA